jgi:hypothetical protein
MNNLKLAFMKKFKLAQHAYRRRKGWKKTSAIQTEPHTVLRNQKENAEMVCQTNHNNKPNRTNCTSTNSVYLEGMQSPAQLVPTLRYEWLSLFFPYYPL